MADRYNSRRDGGAASSTGATRSARGVPRIAGHPQRFALGKRGEPEFRGVRFPDEHRTRPAVARDQFRVVVGDDLLQDARAVAGGHADYGSQQVLHGHGDAGERRLEWYFSQHTSRERIQRAHDSVDGRVARGQARKGRVRNLGHTHVATPDGGGYAETVEVVVFGEGKRVRHRHKSRSGRRRCHGARGR